MTVGGEEWEVVEHGGNCEMEVPALISALKTFVEVSPPPPPSLPPSKTALV